MILNFSLQNDPDYLSLYCHPEFKTNLLPLRMRAELEAAGGCGRLICGWLEVHDLQLRVPDVAVAVKDLPALRLLAFRRQRDV
jgi:hypothetical protein